MAYITILPAQAARIAQEAAKTGAAIGLSQQGCLITLYITPNQILAIDAKGEDLPKQEEKLC